MSANVETMFYTREKPWHGLGTQVEQAPSSREALSLAGLDWEVLQRPITTDVGLPIPGYKANIRNTDNKVLGVVTNRYRVVQNEDAFAFTDDLLGDGITYETAGSLQEGRRIWILARLPHRYILSGDEITPYLVFMNCHDGTGAIKVAMTPIRVVCQNTLNLALNTAKRSWSANHTGSITEKMEEAKNTLFMADAYMKELGKTIDTLKNKKLAEQEVYEYIDALFPLLSNPGEIQKKNMMRMKEELKTRYFDAPDLAGMGNNAYRFINAVSDFATHSEPLRETETFKENLFGKTVDGNAMIDRAYSLMQAF